MLLGGDIHLEAVEDVKEPFGRLQDVLQNDDMVFGNLEGCFYDENDPRLNYYQAKWVHTETSTAPALKEGNIRAVGLANNMVIGGPAIKSTIDILDKMGIAHTGAGAHLAEAREPAIVQSKGVRYGFLARTSIFWPYGAKALPKGRVLIVRDPSDFRRYLHVSEDLSTKGWEQYRSEVIDFMGAPGVATLKARTAYEPSYASTMYEAGGDPIIHTWPDPADLEHLIEDIKNLRPKVDILVTSHHWRLAGKNIGRDHRMEIAHAAIDAGADIVIGAGTHMMHEIEIYKDKPVFYGLGEMFFRHGPAYGDAWKTAPSPGRLLVKVEVKNKKVAAVTTQFLERPTPTEYRLEVWSPDKFPQGMKHLAEISQKFGTRLRAEGDHVVVI
jgi:poly-gamma-glutamate capsule biosynthesis protein CapA/YwtB (metallophosphatase superfamily)